MTKRIDRRAVLRAVIVFVLAVAAFSALSALGSAAAAADATDVATTVVTADAVDVDAVTADAVVDEEDDAGGGSTGLATNRIAQNVFNGVVFGLLLALASVGLSLIYGTTGLSNFAHGEQVSLGAMLAYFFATQQPVSIPLLPVEFTIGWPLWLASIAAIAVAGFTGWLQDRFMWSKLRKRGVKTVQQMIVSIGFSLALLNFLQWWIGPDRLRVSTSIETRRQIGPIQLGDTTSMSIGIAVVALLAVGYFLLRTRLGRATRAVSDNPALAAASGIKVDGIIRLVWVMATSLAALGGILLALYDSGTKFDTGAKLLLLMFAAVTLGGLGQPFGALVGSLVIGVVVETSTLWLGPDLKYATALAILILVLLVRPQGILGRAERVG
ncbi:branched-chain amino acid ABC transporter permease [Demequina muriae]|uniref:Branched-chain amino acid ABC transporter permease n=1 Tax=Demequina muriae TaxID=3051664 RepID=A0ABT8GD13_9MICO|nr:branched-chain amino acid ABC transporter permease [Demequina sp. EGI L300058]MDN4479315.1 branched-chain amino acid ABC transporter permease [Demequina sp. EGI L300058]